MDNNYDLIETNEVGKNANGGTEMYCRFIYDGNIPRELLQKFQIIPSRLRKLDNDKIRIWFEHNLPNDPESMKAIKGEDDRIRFHKIVFLSQWHYQQFQNVLQVPYNSQSHVIEGGFYVDNTPMPEKPDAKNIVHIAYFTTPHRGLELLIPVFQALAVNDKKIHLHVHSSFKMYGWDSRDDQFEPLYKLCREHPQITYHGYTEYWGLRKLLPNYHIFAYPNIWPETMCRAVLEGMYFGLVCVHPNLAAIPDTTGCLNPFMYSGDTDYSQHIDLFMANMLGAIAAVRDNSDDFKQMLAFNRNYIIQRYETRHVQGKWQAMLEDLAARYQTDASKAVQQSSGFTYRIGPS